MKLPSVVWAVGGASGEYSDHHEWPICFYYKESEAKAHVEKATARANEIQNIIKTDDCGNCYSSPSDWCPAHKDLKNEWDPEMSIDYTGVNYYAYALTLYGIPKPRPSQGQEG